MKLIIERESGQFSNEKPFEDERMVEEADGEFAKQWTMEIDSLEDLVKLVAERGGQATVSVENPDRPILTFLE